MRKTREFQVKKEVLIKNRRTGFYWWRWMESGWSNWWYSHSLPRGCWGWKSYHSKDSQGS